jgi:hypothetical protein
MKTNKLFFILCGFVFSVYFIYGLFFPNIPCIRPDDLWEISRANFLLTYHHLGDPMFPAEISPTMVSLYNTTVTSKFFGLIKTGSQALFIGLLPINEVYAFRLVSFAWSLMVCFLTYKLALKASLNKNIALLSTVLLIITPEFFSQLHTERPEMMLSASYLFGLLLFIYTLEMENSLVKKILLFICGVYGWLIAIMIHPNGIIIPLTIVSIYLIKEHKKIFTFNFALLSLGIVGGLFYFYILWHSKSQQELIEGGENLFEKQGPPILRSGIKLIPKLPLIFYNKFNGYNFLSKPFSFILFVTSIFSYIILIKKYKLVLSEINIKILGAAICIPILTLLLLSGSNGHYHIIYIPLCAILIAIFISEIFLKNKSKYLLYFIGGTLSVFFLSNFYGSNQQYKYTKEYFRIMKEVRLVVPKGNETVIANNLYYFNFKDQPFYSASGLSESIGKVNQSFEEAVAAVHADYLIIDDALVYLLYNSRGKTWTDHMFNFIDNNCSLMKEIHGSYYINQIEPIQEKFPVQWKFDGDKKHTVTKIRIYRVSKA